MNIKKLFLLLFLTVSVQALSTVKLVKMVNNSPGTALLNYSEKSFTIHSGSTKNLLVEIPFTHQEKNLFDFIVDQPYVPADALEVVTLDGIFHIWRDERGIIVSKAFVRGMSRKEALPAVFLSLSSEELTRVIGCIVTINNAGSLSIKKS